MRVVSYTNCRIFLNNAISMYHRAKSPVRLINVERIVNNDYGRKSHLQRNDIIYKEIEHIFSILTRNDIIVINPFLCDDENSMKDLLYYICDNMSSASLPPRIEIEYRKITYDGKMAIKSYLHAVLDIFNVSGISLEIFPTKVIICKDSSNVKSLDEYTIDLICDLVEERISHFENKPLYTFGNP